MNELLSLSVTEMHDGLRRGDFSATELTQAHLERTKKTNDVLNSFLTITDDLALNQAKGADRQLRERKDDAPFLTGIPVALKDNLCLRGVETTCASKMLKGFIPPYTGTAVERLLHAGGVVIGKTNLDEFAMGSSTENSAFGAVRNPWDLERVPGGTSGGSAVAVAAGQSAAALGSDTGGSIRQPASFSGVFGMKPTYGRVSRYGLVAYGSSLDQIGPFGRSVKDLAALLEAIAGYDSLDSTSMNVAVPKYLNEVTTQPLSSLAGVRVGIPKEYFIEGIEPDVEREVRDGIALLEKLGAAIVEISLPHTAIAVPAYYILAPAEASSNLARYDGVRYGHRTEQFEDLAELFERTRAEGFGPEVRRRILIGTYVLSAGYYDAYYLKAQQVRTLIANDFKAAFANKCDVIATPVSPTTAFKLGEKVDSPVQMYLADIFTIPVNLAGLPGLSIPCGLDHTGLPVGLQLIGAPFSELQLLRIADRLSAELAFDGSRILSQEFSSIAAR